MFSQSPALSQDPEIIGDAIYGGAPYYQSIGGVLRARYKVVLEDDVANASMFYDSSLARPWGWFTTKDVPCTNGGAEVHDVNGDGEPESGAERHCLNNGDYTLRLDRVTWSSPQNFTSEVIFRRRVALLDRYGSLTHDSSNNDFHDVHVAFDMNAAVTSLFGNIRAGTHYDTIASESDYYPPDKEFAVASGDSLWLISTYRASGNDGRLWYNKYEGLLTQFNRQYDLYPEYFGPAVNSVPTVGTYTKPMLHVFEWQGGTHAFTVVGRVVEPYHDGIANQGRLQLDSALYVTVQAVQACFTYSGTLVVGWPVSFDASCSSGAGPLEYSWDWDDGTPVAPWSTTPTVQHAFGSPGSFDVRLSARRQWRPSDSDDTTRTLTITGTPLSVWIAGPDSIGVAGYYRWTAVASGGTSPYHYQWYYKRGATEQPVGTDSPFYRRYVALEKNPYVFRLRVAVTDSLSSVAQGMLWVGVGGPPPLWAGYGVLDAATTCTSLPSGRSSRQAALTQRLAIGRWPELCVRGPD